MIKTYCVDAQAACRQTSLLNILNILNQCDRSTSQLMTQKVLDLCAGIGGFTLGHMISGGFETVGFCEINEYCQQILNLRFPFVPIIPDIHHVTAESVYARGIREIDGIIAGLPCPPFSVAGKRQASSDERNLFTQFFQVLRSIQPRWAIVENVPGLITAEKGQFFRSVLWEFASLGFDVQWGIMPAAEVGAVHLRERVWIIATNAKSSRRGASRYQQPQAGANPPLVSCGNSCDFYTLSPRTERAIAQPTLRTSNYGFSTGLDRCLLTHAGLTDWLCAATIPSFNRLSRTEVAALTGEEQTEYRQLYEEYLAIRRQHKQQLIALGNAIVPQCAALIFDRLKQILSVENSEVRNQESEFLSVSNQRS